MPNARLTLDPELADALSAIPLGPSGAMFDLTDIQTTREVVRGFVEQVNAQTPDDPSVSVQEHFVARTDGPPLPLRILRPITATDLLPALLWFHGGGQVLGYAAQDDAYLKTLCTKVGCAVVSVDYRLAPEAPPPAAAQDGRDAYTHMLREADPLRIDPARVGLAGASGGAGIAAATALILRDQSAPTPLFQALNYPMLDDRNITASSHEITDIGIWDRRTNQLAWNAILGDQAGTEHVSSYMAPARADNLAGLPPTFIATGELDLFRDEDLDYAARLRAADVPVELHLYPGAFHSWDVFAPASELASAFLDAWYSYLKRQFR